MRNFVIDSGKLMNRTTGKKFHGGTAGRRKQKHNFSPCSTAFPPYIQQVKYLSGILAGVDVCSAHLRKFMSRFVR
jgi:hypothetical protein